MKAVTVVVRTDPDDELPVILERLPTNVPCVLVLPPHSRAFNSLVGAKLLQRRAAALGSRVVVVTADRAVMAHLRAAGIPTAPAVEEAQQILAVEAPDVEQSLTPPPDRAGEGEDDDDDDDARHTTPTIPLSSAVFTAGTLTNGHHEELPDSSAEDEPLPAKPPDPAGTALAGIRGHSGGVRGARDATTPPRPTSPTTPFPRPADIPPPPHTPPRRGLSNVVVTAGIALILLLLLLWLVSYLLGGILNPSATLTLHPRAAPLNAATTVRAIAKLPPNKRDAYHVAMAAINQPEEHMVQLPVRGTKTLPGRVATGRLALANLLKTPLTVPAGTTFTTALNRVGFVSTQAITLKAAVYSFAGTRFGTGTVPIKAALGGSSGNVPARAIVNVPAAFSGALKVENAAPTSGGTDRHIRIVAPRDLSVAAARLFGALDAQAQHDIARRRGGDVVVHTLFVARSPAVPQVAADQRSATLVLSIVLHAVYVHGRDLRPAATAALQQALSGAARGTRLITSSIGWVPTWNPDNTIALAVTGRTAAPLDVAGLRRAIGGRSRAQAVAYLKNRPDLTFTPADLTLSPPWADHLPGDTARINVVVGDPR